MMLDPIAASITIEIFLRWQRTGIVDRFGLRLNSMRGYHLPYMEDHDLLITRDEPNYPVVFVPNHQDTSSPPEALRIPQFPPTRPAFTVDVLPDAFREFVTRDLGIEDTPLAPAIENVRYLNYLSAQMVVMEHASGSSHIRLAYIHEDFFRYRKDS